MSRALTWGVSALVVILVAGLAGGLLLSTTRQGAPLRVEPKLDPTATSEGLTAASALRVFFGHRSVGANILGGVPAVYAAAQLPAPLIVDLQEGVALPGDGPMIAHTLIGRNGDPLGKLANFDARLRAGLAAQVDVAVLKFCYEDVKADTDVDGLFERYRLTLENLERDYPDVTFLHVTTPVTTEPIDLKWRARELIGRPNHNAARERYNALVRSAYGEDVLLDLAAIEATGPDGSLTTISHAGRQHLALAPENAKDPGHLNGAGSAAAAARFLALMSRAGHHA